MSSEKLLHASFPHSGCASEGQLAAELEQAGVQNLNGPAPLGAERSGDRLHASTVEHVVQVDIPLQTHLGREFYDLAQPQVDSVDPRLELRARLDERNTRGRRGTHGLRAARRQVAAQRW